MPIAGPRRHSWSNSRPDADKAGTVDQRDRQNLAAAVAVLIILVAGVPFGTPGSTNVLHVVRLTGNELKEYARRPAIPAR